MMFMVSRSLRVRGRVPGNKLKAEGCQLCCAGRQGRSSLPQLHAPRDRRVDYERDAPWFLGSLGQLPCYTGAVLLFR